VSGHMQKLLVTWGISTIGLGKCVIQARNPKERNSYGLGQQLEGVKFVCMRASRELEVGASMEGKF
jgi:hypothetical protein